MKGKRVEVARGGGSQRGGVAVWLEAAKVAEGEKATAENWEE